MTPGVFCVIISCMDIKDVKIGQRVSIPLGYGSVVGVRYAIYLVEVKSGGESLYFAPGDLSLAPSNRTKWIKAEYIDSYVLALSLTDRVWVSTDQIMSAPDHLFSSKVDPTDDELDELWEYFRGLRLPEVAYPPSTGHDCDSNLETYVGLLDSFKYCKICDKKVRE